jgi:hypothetical protein
MSRTTKILAAVTVAFALVTPVLADDGAMSPAGIWAATNQKSRYEFSLCGDDGTRLCAKAIWLAPGKDRGKFESEIGKNLLDMKPTRKQLTWSGKIRLFGQEADGTIQMVAPDRLHIRACQYFFICAEVDLVPPVDATPPVEQ